MEKETKMNSENRQRSLRKLALLLVVAIFLAGVPVMANSLFLTSNALTLVPSSGVATILIPQLSDLLNEANPTLTVNELAVSTILLHPLPQNLKLSLAASYNGGAPFDFASCVVTQSSLIASCSFTIPWQGWGRYVLIGSIFSSSGGLLAQTSVDPRIEPAW